MSRRYAEYKGEQTTWMLGKRARCESDGTYLRAFTRSDPEKEYTAKIVTAVEKSFYENILSAETIDQIKYLNRSININVPVFIDGGRVDDKDYFVVTQKLDCLSVAPPMSDATFKNLVRNILDALTYLHAKRIFHGNVTPKSILEDNGTYYLSNFTRVKRLSASKPTDALPALAHPPLLYTGVDEFYTGPSKRADLESLIFCMLEWAQICLPWKDIANPAAVFAKKSEFFSAPDAIVNSADSNLKAKIIFAFVKEKNNLDRDIDAVPDYKRLRKQVLLTNNRAETEIPKEKCVKAVKPKEPVKKFLDPGDNIVLAGKNFLVLDPYNSTGEMKIFTFNDGKDRFETADGREVSEPPVGPFLLNWRKDLLLLQQTVKSNTCKFCVEFTRFKSKLKNSENPKDSAAIQALEYLNIW